MAVNNSPFLTRLTRAISFNVLLTRLLGSNKTNLKVTPLQTLVSRSFIFYFNKKNYQISKAINNKQLDFSSIRRLILLMYYDQVFLLSNYSIIRFLICCTITFFFYVLRILYLPWVGTTWVQVSRSSFPFWAFFKTYFIIFRVKCISTTYIQFSALVCITL